MARIPHDPPADRAFLAGGGQAGGDDYIAKVVKLIPSEVIATYTAVYNLISSLPKNWWHNVYWGNAIFFWIATPCVLWLIGKKEGKLPSVVTLVISTLAFGVWGYAVSGSLVIGDPGFQPALAGIVLIMFTFVVGFIPLS